MKIGIFAARWVNDQDKQFEHFVKEVKHDLANDSLPVIFAQTGKGNSVNWKKVKECQEKVWIKNVYMIKTDDLNYQSGVAPHFTTKSYIEIEKKFASAYMDQLIVSTIK